MSNYTQPFMRKVGTTGEHEPLRGDAQGLHVRPVAGVLLAGATDYRVQGSMYGGPEPLLQGVQLTHLQVSNLASSSADESENNLYIMFDTTRYLQDGNNNPTVWAPYIHLKPGESWAGDVSADALIFATSLYDPGNYTFGTVSADAARVRYAVFGFGPVSYWQDQILGAD